MNKENLRSLSIVGFILGLIGVAIMFVLLFMNMIVPNLVMDIIMLGFMGSCVASISRSVIIKNEDKLKNKIDKRRLSITTKMFLKALISVLFFICYCNLVRRVTDGTSVLVNQCIILSCVWLIIIAKNTSKDIEDEFVLLAIKKTDSICFKIAMLFMILIMFLAGFEVFSIYVLGYLVGICFIALNLLRAVICFVYNKRGI